MPDKGQKKQIDQCFDYKKNILFYVLLQIIKVISVFRFYWFWVFCLGNC